MVCNYPRILSALWPCPRQGESVARRARRSSLCYTGEAPAYIEHGVFGRGVAATSVVMEGLSVVVDACLTLGNLLAHLHVLRGIRKQYEHTVCRTGWRGVSGCWQSCV